ncbi:MAG: nucleotidyl transferase AbiEii/AbiGii toxin family protein [Candidatus Bathyarchaeota archaeon]|nr:nucleotidyl transferase AbiEii/AbiGii toxin family protein [Candidatus Bathyarchaeota archaeon]
MSEFVAFVAEKSGVAKPLLIEKDIIIHRILRDLCGSGDFAENYLFKGGSCLVKCYFGYYRFSVDLDFTWRHQAVWVGLGKHKLRKRLLEETAKIGALLEQSAQKLGLDFKNEPENTRYFEFGGGCRMVTCKLWKASEFTKIQVNFVDEILFAAKTVAVKTLLDGALLSKYDRAYFAEELSAYGQFNLHAYSEKEILCEKVRAVLTRRGQKLRDFYDLYVLEKSGYKIEDLKEQAVSKIRSCLNFSRYRANLRNRASFELSSVLEEPFERSLFVVQPPEDFDLFLKQVPKKFVEIINRVDCCKERRLLS